ncbi:SAM-dependent methyltransferase [Mycobacterium sp. CBMA 234]|uniref:class I SAM-dependent methyltransferase n=1 Tax=Mycolicibacterium sp. CBMA 234 TaxID=1918495 RepID=UPI0012DE423B|nr:class I SAM-dependent methyltransferase [Mycolicibacterium sp. CBMA 234]MUL67605.1 SAM-dependent methyltransferase [Mycolicibacterium sp. CBMA 234]
MSTWSVGRYEAVAGYIAPIAAEVVAAVPTGPGTALVDLACGTGNAALRAAGLGAQVTGVDITPELLAIAAAKPGGDTVDWVAADASATGLPDAAFDAAISNMGIIFVEPTAMVAELARVLKPGGALGFSAWVRAGDNPFFTPIVEVLGPPATAPYSPEQWGVPELVHARLKAEFADVAIQNGVLTWRFGSLDDAVRFITDESPVHVSTLAALDEATRARLVTAFTAALAAHQSPDGTVAFDAPYAVITAHRR